MDVVVAFAAAFDPIVRTGVAVDEASDDGTASGQNMAVKG